MFNPGDDVIVVFDGEEYEAEVIEHRKGRVMAYARIDPAADHGAMTPMLAPTQTVNVAETDVRLAGDG